MRIKRTAEINHFFHFKEIVLTEKFNFSLRWCEKNYQSTEYVWCESETCEFYSSPEIDEIELFTWKRYALVKSDKWTIFRNCVDAFCCTVCLFRATLMRTHRNVSSYDIFTYLNWTPETKFAMAIEIPMNKISFDGMLCRFMKTNRLEE